MVEGRLLDVLRMELLQDIGTFCTRLVFRARRIGHVLVMSSSDLNIWCESTVLRVMGGRRRVDCQASYRLKLLPALLFFLTCSLFFCNFFLQALGAGDWILGVERIKLIPRQPRPETWMICGGKS